MVFVLALGAALANALTSIFQRMGVEKAPESATLRLSLDRAMPLHKKIWLLGFALMIVSFLLQATALHLGRLSQVQPVLTTELVFLVAVLATWFGFSVGRREWLGSLAVDRRAGGLPVLRRTPSTACRRRRCGSGSSRAARARWPSGWR